jgi:alkylhydroperoxidase family enzyme
MSARVGYLSQDQLPAHSQGLMTSQHNVERALANNVDALMQFAYAARWMRSRMKVDPRLRELAILQVATILESGYVFSHHLKIAQRAGVIGSDIIAVLEDSKDLPQEDASHTLRSVLEAAHALTLDADLPDECWNGLVSAVGADQAIELVVTISYYGHLVRIIRGLRIELEPEYLEVLFNHSVAASRSWR